jgi:Holliday junction DNA helicase RuvB
LLKRVRDFQQVNEDELISIATTRASLQLLQVDEPICYSWCTTTTFS